MNAPHLKIIKNFISNSDELYKQLKNNVVWDERMKARKTASFGVSYDYSGIEYPQSSMPDSLNLILDKIEHELGFKPNNCLMNYYLDGNSSMGYHSDSSEELLDGTGVAILSLGAERIINYKFKRDSELIHSYLLEAGTLLYMDDEVQENWLHAIPKSDVKGGRISLTFRHILK